MEKGNRPSLPEVKFRYQRDPNFQLLVDLGIGSALSDSGYCWAACLDMALSPFVVEDKIRQGVVLDAVRDERLATGVFNAKGELLTGKIEDFVAVINETLSTGNLSPRLTLIREPRDVDFHLELQKGRIIIFGVGNKTDGHAMIMDKVYKDGGKYNYLLYDPGIEDPTKARQHVDSFELYGRTMYLDSKLHPFIISVGQEAK
jgi:hypothetical protein